jgi:hypothetical protein
VRGARAACVFTVCRAESAHARRPSALVACETSLAGPSRMMNVPRAERSARGVERRFGNVDRGVLQSVAERDERGIGTVIDGEDRARALDAPGAPTVPATGSIFALSTAGSTTRVTLTLNSSGKLLGRRCTAASADRSGSRTACRAACPRCGSTAGPSGRCSCRRRTRASRSSREDARHAELRHLGDVVPSRASAIRE